MQVDWTQPFHWGLLLAYDQDEQFQTPDLDRAGNVAATPSCLAIPVRHAQDIDYPEDVAPDAVLPWTEVKVTVLVGLPLPRTPEFEGLLQCPFRSADHR